MKILKKAEIYLEQNEIEMTPEELFIHFKKMVDCHGEFNEYLKKTNLNKKLNKMQRNKRLIEKRKLFTEWYILQNQNSKRIKEMVNDVSEMVFASTRTVFKDLSDEATD